MNKFNKILYLSLIMVIGAWSFVSAQTPPKHPPKPKPEPVELILPAPFERWSECDLLSKIYTAYNCKTGSIGRRNKEVPAETSEEVAEVKKVSLWKTGGKKQLLVLIETGFARPYEAGITGKGVDLALFDASNNRLILTAFADGVVGYREFGRSKFDLAPYKLNAKETAVGIRWTSGINGVGEEFLDLFRLDQRTFRSVFSREMWVMTDSVISVSILQVVQNPSGMNDFLLITNTYRMDDEGKREKKVIKRVEETWRWNEQAQAYKTVN